MSGATFGYPRRQTAVKIRLVGGEEEPEIQGWYSREYNEYEPNVTSIYTTEINSGSRFVWLLYPLNRLKRGSGLPSYLNGQMP